MGLFSGHVARSPSLSPSWSVFLSLSSLVVSLSLLSAVGPARRGMIQSDRAMLHDNNGGLSLLVHCPASLLSSQLMYESDASHIDDEHFTGIAKNLNPVGSN